MRKITQKAVKAFEEGKNFTGNNTKVVTNEYETAMYLFGNKIAWKNRKGFFITNCGRFSNTTKERLNGFDGVSITTKNGIWHLNGEVWNGNIRQVK